MFNQPTKKQMNKQFDYSAMNDLEMLQYTSLGWTETYNFIKGFKTLEEWEHHTLDQLILSEKVFDV